MGCTLEEWNYALPPQGNDMTKMHMTSDELERTRFHVRTNFKGWSRVKQNARMTLGKLRGSLAAVSEQCLCMPAEDNVDESWDEIPELLKSYLKQFDRSDANANERAIETFEYRQDDIEEDLR